MTHSEQGKTLSVQPGDQFYMNFPTLPGNEGVDRRKKDSPQIQEMHRMKKAFMSVITNEMLAANVSKLIAEGKMNEDEMFTFVNGLGLVIIIGDNEEKHQLRAFLSAPDFRVRGNAYLSKYIRENYQNKSSTLEVMKELILAINNAG